MKNKKILIISTLVIVVIGLAIGFAAFSSALTISSSSTVTPSSSTFKVRLSSSSTEYKSGPLLSSPTIVGNVSAPGGFVMPGYTSDTGYGSGFIVGDGGYENPIAFVEPGASVTYKMYIRNDGEYTAYLNSIEFENSSSGSSFKVCTPGEGTTASLVQNACNYISVTVTTNNSTSTQTTTNESKTGIDGFSIEPGESYPVNITYSYASNGSRADGPFEVSFGTILFRYSTVD